MELVAPLIAVPARFHAYVIVPEVPSSSVTEAVRVSSSVAVPEMAADASSLTLDTADVGELVRLSAVPCPSVYDTVTVIAESTSSCPRV